MRMIDLFDLEKIGDGSFSQIHKMKTKSRKNMIVIKEMKKSKNKRTDFCATHFHKEKDCLSNFDHPFIRKFYGFVELKESYGMTRSATLSLMVI
jgi:serine/threonine protein kinase